MIKSSFSLLIYALSTSYTTEAIPCDFCSRGEISRPDRNVTIPGYEFLDTCGTIDSLAPALLTDDNPQCEILQSLSSYCGCPPVQDSCSLCRDGSPVELPEKTFPWLAGVFGGIAPTCELVEAYAASFGSDDAKCHSLHAISSHCGCPAVSNHCVYCDGEALKEEYRDVELPGLANFGIIVTCDIYFLTQYQYNTDHEFCKYNEIVSSHCGCNNGVSGLYGVSNTTQQEAALWVPRVVGVISLFASFLILLDIGKSETKRSKVYHQLVAIIAVFDVITSVVWIVGPAAAPAISEFTGLSSEIYGASGSDATCTAQGFFLQLGLTSTFLNVSLTVYFYLVVASNIREPSLKKMRISLFGPPLLLGVGLSFASIPFISKGLGVCLASTYPVEEYLWSLLLFTVVPIMLALVVIVFLLVLIYCQVSGRIDESIWSSTDLQGVKGMSSARRKLRREVFWQCLAYGAAFGLTWPVLAVSQLAPALGADWPFGFWIFSVTVMPIQGLSNALCYFRSHIQKVLCRCRGRPRFLQQSSPAPPVDCGASPEDQRDRVKDDFHSSMHPMIESSGLEDTFNPAEFVEPDASCRMQPSTR